MGRPKLDATKFAVGTKRKGANGDTYMVIRVNKKHYWRRIIKQFTLKRKERIESNAILRGRNPYGGYYRVGKSRKFYYMNRNSHSRYRAKQLAKNFRDKQNSLTGMIHVSGRYHHLDD